MIQKIKLYDSGTGGLGMVREDIATWDFNDEHYLETESGNFIFSDPEFGGTNILRRTKITYEKWICHRNSRKHPQVEKIGKLFPGFEYR